MTHYIRHIKGHIEVYDDQNRFVLSGDTITEIMQDLELILAKQYKTE